MYDFVPIVLLGSSFFFPFVIRRCVLGENVKIIVRYYEVDE